MRLKWASFTSSNGAQNVCSLEMATGGNVVQIYLDTASATMRVYRSQNGADDALINLTGKAGQWGTVGARWSGSGSVTVWYLDDLTSTWTEITISGTTASALGQIEIAKYSFGGEEPNQLLICNSMIRSGYMTQAECTAQRLTDVPSNLSSGSGASLNRHWPFDTTSTGGNDSSGNGYNATIYSGGSTQSDVPYGAAGISGTAAITTAAVSVSSAATARVSGASSLSLAATTFISAATVLVSGATAGTLAAASVSAAGTVPARGTLAGTLDGATVSASGGTSTASTNGSASITLAGAAVSAAATARVSGTLAGTLASAAVTAAGVQTNTGAVSATLAGCTVSAIGSLQQETSTSANGQWGLQIPWDDHLELPAFTLMVRARVHSWTSGDQLQNILGANCQDGYVQIYASVNGTDPDLGGANYIRVYQGEEAPVAYYALNSTANYSGWALYAIRNNGLGGDTEVVMIPDGGSPIVLSLTGDFGDLRQIYFAGLVAFPEQAEDVYFCTGIVVSEYWDNAKLLAQAEQSTPVDTSDLNRFFPMSNASTAYIDQSGNGWNANPGGTGLTVSDSPYIVTGASGSAAVTLASASVSSSGTVAVRGAASNTLANASVSGTLVASIRGETGLTLDSVSGSATGTVLTHAAATITLADTAVQSDGLIEFDGIAGTSHVTLDNATSAIAGAVLMSGALDKRLIDTTMAATCAVAVVGSASNTLGSCTLSATGAGTNAGTVAASLASCTVAAAGTITAFGSLNRALESASVAGTGAVTSADRLGAVEATLDAATATGAAVVYLFGSASITLADATLTAATAGMLPSVTATARLLSAENPITATAQLGSAAA
jgi:hypothetical protein